MSLPPLTRAAALDDFPGCASVHGWQQAHAIQVHHRWRQTSREVEGRTVVYNWSAARFVAPETPPAPTDYYDRPEASVFLGDATIAAFYACSVLDRVAEPRRFLRQAHAALVPGGLFVATFALWDAVGPDVTLGSGVRRRIYDRHEWKRLIEDGRSLGYRTFGGVDLRYRGDTLADHSLGSLVLVKEIV